MLVSAARTGDPAAIESLTMDDIDTYSKVSQRLISEDVFSIVDTYIMPYGIECDHYSIMGEILELQRITNEYSREEIYVMVIREMTETAARERNEHSPEDQELQDKVPG